MTFASVEFEERIASAARELAVCNSENDAKLILA